MVAPNRISIPPTTVKRPTVNPVEPGTKKSPDHQIRCPVCESTNCKSARMIFEQGTHEREFTGIGVGLRGGGGSLFGGIGSSQSLMAQRCAPPSARSTLGPVILIAIGALTCLFVSVAAVNSVNAPRGMNDPGPNTAAIVAFAVIFGIIAMAGIAWWIAVSGWNAVELPRRRQRWSNIWVCMKCGASWDPSEIH